MKAKAELSLSEKGCFMLLVLVRRPLLATLTNKLSLHGIDGRRKCTQNTPGLPNQDKVSLKKYRIECDKSTKRSQYCI